MHPCGESGCRPLLSPFPTLFKLPVKICPRGKKVRNGSALDSPLKLKGTKAPNRLLFIAPAYALMECVYIQ